MDWFQQLNNDVMVVVPTRGLQHSLQQRYAEQQMKKGRSVWETPNILVWDDLVDELYRRNKAYLGEPKSIISDAQSFLIWQQVIAKSKKSENALTLLNEAQTASAVQRSWKLHNKWRVDDVTQHLNSDQDATMFKQWCSDYEVRMQQAALIDNVQRESLLVTNTAKLQGLPETLIFAYFDLQTSHQRLFIEACEDRGVDVHVKVHMTAEAPKSQIIEYHHYLSDKDELATVFKSAREYLEANPEAKIGIVIPDLAQRRQSIETQSRQIFYPNRSPLDGQSEDAVYRFSLGYSLREVPYIGATLRLLNLLKSSFSYQDISYIFRCRWLPLYRDYSTECLQLIRELKKSRTVYWTWERLGKLSHSLFEGTDTVDANILEISESQQFHPITQLIHTCTQFQAEYLKADSKASTKTTQLWQSIFSEWFEVFDWHKNQLDSYHYQAEKSWETVQETFISFDQVQLPIGLSRAIQQIQTLCTEAVYLRQARNEPILISGVLEAIGQPADILYVTGMHENYPVPLGGDAFIANDALAEQGYPFADKAMEFVYEKQKLNSLLAEVPQLFISYSSENEEGKLSQTALLREKTFKKKSISAEPVQRAQLIEYKDTIGEPCRNSAMIKGGAKVFENQSHCPFRAYIVHRILYDNEQEPEFGLDARDSGNVMHKLLENIWQEMGTFSTLRLSTTDLSEIVTRHVDQFLNAFNDAFQYDRRELLLLERGRLIALLEEWLTLERDERVLGFNVIAKESEINSEFAKIPIRLIIDRIDRLTEINQDLIIDYKTGLASPNDWLGERPRNPQLPLYVVALEEYRQKNNIAGDITGIAFAQVKRGKVELKGFAGTENIAAKISHTKIGRETLDWNTQLLEWRANLGAIAEEFLQGEAWVEPLKDVCKYCDLASVCRINQLREQSEHMRGGSS